MSSPAPFGAVGELFERSLNIKHVYGEPVHRGDLTVVPVARVTYGFGAGGGQRPDARRGRHAETAQSDAPPADAQGAGGGGFGHMTPIGVVEIGPHGVRFVQFHTLAPLLGAAAVGALGGCLLAWLARLRLRSASK
jgi:uncharacterized spore protein YtfJ